MMRRRDVQKVQTIMLHDKHKCSFCQEKAEAVIYAKKWFNETTFCVCHKHYIDWNNSRLDVE